jgi:hypothetical protein
MLADSFEIFIVRRTQTRGSSADQIEPADRLTTASFDLSLDSTLIERIAHPTLSELIKAYPKEMGAATFVLASANEGQAWIACYFNFGTNRGAKLNETGQTPDEAVARLWLALNRKGGNA